MKEVLWPGYYFNINDSIFVQVLFTVSHPHRSLYMQRLHGSCAANERRGHGRRLMSSADIMHIILFMFSRTVAGGGKGTN